MAHDDMLHPVPGADQVQRIGRDGTAVGFIVNQAPVPDRAIGSVQEIQRVSLRFPVGVFQENGAAHLQVDLRDGQVPAVEIPAQTGMDKEVPADDPDRVPGRDPAAQFAVGPEQGAVFHAQFPGQDRIFRFGVAQVVGEDHRLMVAQEHGDAAAGLFRLPLQFVEEPENRDDIVSPVEDIPDHRQVVPSVGPLQVLVDHAVAPQQADDAVQAPVRIGHDEQFVRLAVLAPGFAADLPQADLEGELAAVVRHPETLRPGGHALILDVAGGIDPDHPGGAVFIQQIRSVHGEGIPPGLRGVAGNQVERRHKDGR